MAKEALAGFLYGMEEDGESIPVPSDPGKMEIPPGTFVALVEAWTDIVRDEIENKAIKKTLTIPKWLNDIDEREKVNFFPFAPDQFKAVSWHPRLPPPSN